MFEKDAEESSKKAFCVAHTHEDELIYRNGFQQGAEFGYNKALEEIGDLRDCCNCKHWKYSTRSLSYYCDKTSRVDDCQLQYYRCEHWER